MEARHFEVKESKDGEFVRKGFKFRKVSPTHPKVPSPEISRESNQKDQQDIKTNDILSTEIVDTKKRKSIDKNQNFQNDTDRKQIRNLNVTEEGEKQAKKKAFYPKIQFQISNSLKEFQSTPGDNIECLHQLLQEITETESKALDYFFQSNGRKETDPLLITLKQICREIPSEYLSQIESHKSEIEATSPSPTSSLPITFLPELSSRDRLKRDSLLSELREAERVSSRLDEYLQDLSQANPVPSSSSLSSSSSSTTLAPLPLQQIQFIEGHCEQIDQLLQSLSSECSSAIAQTEEVQSLLRDAKESQAQLFDLYQKFMRQYQLHIPPSGDGNPIPLSYHVKPVKDIIRSFP